MSDATGAAGRGGTKDAEAWGKTELRTLEDALAAEKERGLDLMSATHGLLEWMYGMSGRVHAPEMLRRVDRATEAMRAYAEGVDDGGFLCPACGGSGRQGRAGCAVCKGGGR